MTKIIEFLAVVFAAVAGWVSSTPEVVKILLIVMFFDIVAGSIKAATIDKKLSSSVAWSGAGKKAMTLIIVGLTFAVSGMIAGEALSHSIGQTIAAFFVYAETVSVLQNAAMVGIPIPDFLKNALDTINPDKSRNQSGTAG